MPQLAMLGLGLGGSLLGGIGKGGDKVTDLTRNTHTTGNSLENSSQQGWQQEFEDPWFGAARQGIMGGLFGQMKKANQPVFGQAQQAQYLQQLNGLAQSSIDSLKSNLARTGGLDSGRLASGLTDIGLGRMNQASNFYAQLPFQEKQAQAALMNPLLQIGAGWTGAAPKARSTSMFGTTDKTFEENSQQTGQEVQKGQPWWRGMASNLGGLAGMMFGDMWGDMSGNQQNGGGSGGGGTWV